MKRAFTLIELLIVIAIIGVLSSIALSAFSEARISAREAWRKASLKQIANALQLYYDEHGYFPHTKCSKGDDGCYAAAAALLPQTPACDASSHGCLWYGEQAGYGQFDHTGAWGYIPGLAPQHIASLAQDPLVNSARGGCVAGQSGFKYSSDGLGYKVVIYCLAERSPVSPANYFYDKSGYRDTSYAIYSGDPWMAY